MKIKKIFIFAFVITASLFVWTVGKGIGQSTEKIMDNEQKARNIAFKAYCNKQYMNVMAEEAATKSYSIKLGFDISGFANKGDEIWEVRIEYFFSQLRSIVWVNLANEKVFFVIGPWHSDQECHATIEKGKDNPDQ